MLAFSYVALRFIHFAALMLIFGNAFNGHYPASGTGVGISAYSGGVAAKAAVAELNQ